MADGTVPVDHIFKESIEGSINAIVGVDDGCEPVDRVKYEESENEPYNYVVLCIQRLLQRENNF